MKNFIKMKQFLLLEVLLVLFVGCDTSGIPFGYVTGKITIDDKPAPENMVIYFIPQISGGSPSKGFTDANGNYEMKFSITRKGVEAGSNKVTIENPEGGKAVVPRNVLKANNKELWTKIIEVKKGKQKLDFNIDTTIKVEPEPPRRNERTPVNNKNEVTDADEG
ncbi:MAG: hypothetical protein LBL62_02855 [Planctomycetaceae bacterium]|jgi:hypothetical protein|nr:hypothetical protein [Planctomycetaceae bacterium]